MNLIQKKQTRLNDFGISDFKQEKSTSFVKENAKPLLIYLNDTEKKLQVFDLLLSQLELYVKIINERRFTNKSIKISKDSGIEVILNSRRKLDLAKLSSGEQQEIILLFELLFHTNQKDLIMIDEPEISLHVAWQKDFLSDLVEIQKITNSNFMLATHSPQIINDRWDLTIDLWGIANEK
jgi:predicted ATP-binding protein involved in virulence